MQKFKFVLTIRDVMRGNYYVDLSFDNYEEFKQMYDYYSNDSDYEVMSVTADVRDIGKDIMLKHKELLHENKEAWEYGNYSISKAWEDAVKSVCLVE